MEIGKKDGLQGVWNYRTNSWMIEPKYELGTFRVNKDYFGYIRAVDLNKRCGVFDTNGKLVIPFKYQSISDALPGFLFIASDWNDKYGVIDVNDRVICPFIYDHIRADHIKNRKISRLSDVVLIAKKYGKNRPAFGFGCEGLIRLDGTPLTDFIYDLIHIESDYITTLKDGWKEVLVKPDYFAYIDYKDKRYFVDKKWQVIRIKDKNPQHSKPQTTTRNTSNSSIKTAAAIGVFVGLAAVIIDAISSSSSSSSSSYSSSSSSSSSSYSSSSSSSSSSYSSSKQSVSVCPECTGRGMRNCVWCHGKGMESHLFEEDTVCSWCDGRGQVWCWQCNGTGSKR